MEEMDRQARSDLRYPYICNAECVFVRLQAIVVATSGPGFPQTVESRAGDALAQILSLECTPERMLIVDCRGINEVTDRALTPFEQAWNNCKPGQVVIFTRCSQIKERLEAHLNASQSSFTDLNSKVRYVLYSKPPGRNLAHSDIIRLCDDMLTAEHRFIRRVLGSSFSPYNQPKRLKSTPVMGNGELVSQRILSNPMIFTWISILLVDALSVALVKSRKRTDTIRGNLNGIDELRFLAYGLIGGALAYSLGLLLSERLAGTEIIHHIAAFPGRVEEYSLGPFSGAGGFVYVSDFIVGATEMKRAETYAASRGARLTHAAVIGSWLSEEHYSDTIKIVRLVDLQDTVNGDLKIRIQL